MRPTRAVLEYALNAARKEFRSVSLAQAERIGCTVMYIPGGSAFGVSGQITQNWFDEPVVCWNGHISTGDCILPLIWIRVKFHIALRSISDRNFLSLSLPLIEKEPF